MVAKICCYGDTLRKDRGGSETVHGEPGRVRVLRAPATSAQPALTRRSCYCSALLACSTTPRPDASRRPIPISPACTDMEEYYGVPRRADDADELMRGRLGERLEVKASTRAAPSCACLPNMAER
jgi:hypothetical protein